MTHTIDDSKESTGSKWKDLHVNPSSAAAPSHHAVAKDDNGHGEQQLVVPRLADKLLGLELEDKANFPAQAAVGAEAPLQDQHRMHVQAAASGRHHGALSAAAPSSQLAAAAAADHHAATASSSRTSSSNICSSKQGFEDLFYLHGLGNHLESEAIKGALPIGRNNPRVCPLGLYAEQISGTSFTTLRAENQRSWLYRIKPSVTHMPFSPSPSPNCRLISNFNDASLAAASPNQLRWLPFPLMSAAGDADVTLGTAGALDFVGGLWTVCGSGSPSAREGFAVHMYAASESMKNSAFANADGDFLVVPQHGRLWIKTEFGRLQVADGEIVVLPRGIRFSVDLPDGPSRGYVCEVFGSHFKLPELGPIGANGLACPRDFVSPTAWFDDHSYDSFKVTHKYDGSLFEASQDFSPFNVVAWHGTYVPFKYDLSRFCPMNAVSFDHPDPSIFTVLTCPSAYPGVATLDFVIFPPRWTVAEKTFRPPYFHRNCMSEFMGLIRGVYEAKVDGFLPGGASLHSCMTPHGPDTATFENAVSKEHDEIPEKLPESTLAFMFESCFMPRVTHQALNAKHLDQDYYKCWQGLRSHFKDHLPGVI